MDLEAIDYFIMVAEAQSLSHAAKRYGLPKSSLSHKVRKLEDSLGVALFVRDGRELHLSDAGAEFLDHAQRIKESCEGAKAAIAEARHDIAGTLTIGSTGEFGTSFTSELLFAFRQQYPQVRVDVIFLSLGYFSRPKNISLSTAFSIGASRPIPIISRANWARVHTVFTPVRAILSVSAHPPRPTSWKNTSRSPFASPPASSPGICSVAEKPAISLLPLTAWPMITGC